MNFKEYVEKQIDEAFLDQLSNAAQDAQGVIDRAREIIVKGIGATKGAASKVAGAVSKDGDKEPPESSEPDKEPEEDKDSREKASDAMKWIESNADNKDSEEYKSKINALKGIMANTKDEELKSEISKFFKDISDKKDESVSFKEFVKNIQED